MPQVDVRGSEVRSAIIRFKRICDKLGILKRLREESRETKPTTKRKKAKDAARKRLLKKIAKEKYDLTAAKNASRNRRRTFDSNEDASNAAQRTKDVSND